jgi:hypothetical protein
MKRDRGRDEKPVSDPLFFFFPHKRIAGNCREGKTPSLIGPISLIGPMSPMSPIGPMSPMSPMSPIGPISLIGPIT